ncbi:MAG: hypothetical protein UX28_C0003G0131 [Candidatus Pacebacteria bacterium GW2011_GWA1_46_10]|nr:MAG: hypothetical protein UX28_C0003G0131 [Candidatus Pacebacteria bacterium GW2011_GWA1_46_10]HCR81577.1 hypothetical protein [Candidatus Paceibacterota bacterium]
MTEKEPQLTHEHLSSLSPREIVQLIDTEEKVIFVINELLLAKEDETYRGGQPVRKETKIYFMIGDNVTNDLRRTRNLDQTPVRTKPAPYFKVPEVFEVMPEISGYLEGKENHTLPTLYSEVSDIFYNLFHLQKTDPDAAVIYEKLIRSLAKMMGLSLIQIGQIAIIKYKIRMYDNQGKNQFGTEDKAIESVFDLIPTATHEQISNLGEGINALWNRMLLPRLAQLRGELEMEEIGSPDEPTLLSRRHL